MEDRVIGSIVVVTLAFSAIAIGGLYYQMVTLFLAIMGLAEFIKAYDKKLPIPVLLISMLSLSLLVVSNFNINTFDLDIRLVIFTIIAFLFPLVYYHDLKKYDIHDATYLMSGVLFISVAMTGFNFVMNQSWRLLLYLLMITTLTDTFAFICGKSFGKTKLCKELSPNKTVEGAACGTVIATFAATAFYLLAYNPHASALLVFLISMFLSVVGQIGDLIFSSIKRTFKIKDFSDAVPGHGGILDRLDSIILVIIVYIILSTII